MAMTATRQWDDNDNNNNNDTVLVLEAEPEDPPASLGGLSVALGYDTVD